jgi:uncharacterized protein (TIGR00255 family)
VLLSMTGFGEARYESDSLSVAIELRSVNNRYLKVSVRAAEPFHLLEPEFEKVIRRTARRGTVQVHLRFDRQAAAGDFRINTVALRAYLGQVRAVSGELGLSEQQSSALFGQVLALPGVVPEPGQASLSLEDEWPLIERVLNEALAKLQTMRQGEGKAMADDLLLHHGTISGQLDQIRRHLPSVTAAYRDRLHERVRKLLGDANVQVSPDDMLKELAIFAERSDVAEEVVRLASHLDQFRTVLDEPESPGRKLEFLVQEMGREVNTIGSKAGDVAVARYVVEIKGALEKIRELIQNVE